MDFFPQDSNCNCVDPDDVFCVFATNCRQVSRSDVNEILKGTVDGFSTLMSERDIGSHGDRAYAR
jgi:hypothetical protein